MSSTSAQLNEADLIGTWRLNACEGRADDGAVLLLYSDNPEVFQDFHTRMHELHNSFCAGHHILSSFCR